ncbi:nuclear cap binding protein, putative, partial [Eimeria tenella]
AEWHSRTTLRFYQSSELGPLLSPAAAEGAPLLEFPFLQNIKPQLLLPRMQPLETLLRLPASLQHVDIPLPPHDQWILEDYFLTILRNFLPNISLCAEQLLRVPVDHPQFDYVLVECLFSEMLRLPRSPIIRGASGAPFAYARLLHRLCQLQNPLISVVETLLTSLVRRSIDMDHQTLLTLSDFFGYWLNAWGGPSKLLEEWVGVGRGPPSTKLFIKLALEKAMRINYPDALCMYTSS